MTVNISLPTRNVDYSGSEPLPDRVKIKDINLQANYYKRFYMTMSHGPMYEKLYESFRRVLVKEMEQL